MPNTQVEMSKIGNLDVPFKLSNRVLEISEESVDPVDLEQYRIKSSAVATEAIAFLREHLHGMDQAKRDPSFRDIHAIVDATIADAFPDSSPWHVESKIIEYFHRVIAGAPLKAYEPMALAFFNGVKARIESASHKSEASAALENEGVQNDAALAAPTPSI
jgi:hypothetical protein